MARGVMRVRNDLPRRHGLGDNTLQGNLLLLQVLSGRILDLELSHGVGEGLLDLVLLATLELERKRWVGDDVLNTGDVRLKLLLGFETLREGLVVGLELLGIGNHRLDLGAGELAHGVGDGDVCGASGRLLGGW